MKRLFLFPRKLRLIGIIILTPAIVFWVAITYFDFGFSFLNYFPSHHTKDEMGIYGIFRGSDGNYNNTVDYALILIALVFIAFSKIKTEDEMTIMLRLQSFQIVTCISLSLLLILDFTAFGLDYIAYATMLWYAFLILFIVVFYTKIYLLTKSVKNEK
ncbi:MAG: hypothetical protein PW786_03975 [Arachidicoccus sp.]|nr:hypothetical protein [Arachidicoccus sp.]